MGRRSTATTALPEKPAENAEKNCSREISTQVYQPSEIFDLVDAVMAQRPAMEEGFVGRSELGRTDGSTPH